MFERYRLEKNDDLFSIAKKYNTTVKALQDINNIYYLDSLREGMEIIVPSETKEYFNYYELEKPKLKELIFKVIDHINL